MVVAKKGAEGRWRYLAFRLVFTLERRCLRARVANDDAPLAPPADSREVRLVVGEDGDPALLTDPNDDRRAIHTRERTGGGDGQDDARMPRCCCPPSPRKGRPSVRDCTGRAMHRLRRGDDADTRGQVTP